MIFYLLIMFLICVVIASFILFKTIYKRQQRVIQDINDNLKKTNEILSRIEKIIDHYHKMGYFKRK